MISLWFLSFQSIPINVKILTHALVMSISYAVFKAEEKLFRDQWGI